MRILFSALFFFAVFLSLGQQLTFSRVQLPLVRDGSRGVAIGDLDGDGFAEIVVANQLMKDRPSGNPIYFNSKGKQFLTKETGTENTHRWSESVALIDVDGDNDLDIFFATQFYQTNPLFINNGNGQFAPNNAGDLSSDSTNSPGSCWCDFDNDGDMDVFVVNRDGDDDALYVNDGKGFFTRQNEGPWIGNGGDGRSCVWGDLNNDGFTDLYVTNFVVKENGEVTGKHRNYLYLNNGDLGFSEQRMGAVVEDQHASYGVSVIDFEYDHDLDLYVTNVSSKDDNALYRNNGDGTFEKLSTSPVAEFTNRPSKGQTWGDFNNDGHLDLYIANGTEVYPEIQNFLFTGNDDGTFHRVYDLLPVVDPHISAGTAVADIDNDGDLDIYVCNWGAEAEMNDLYRNEIQNTNWIKFSLQGNKSNSKGIGTWIIIKTIEGIQTRYHYLQTGYGSQNNQEVHFGLGAAERVDELTLEWPSGEKQQFKNIDKNSWYQITEGKDNLFKRSK